MKKDGTQCSSTIFLENTLKSNPNILLFSHLLNIDNHFSDCFFGFHKGENQKVAVSIWKYLLSHETFNHLLLMLHGEIFKHTPN